MSSNFANGDGLPDWLALLKGVWLALAGGYKSSSGFEPIDQLASRGGMASMLTTVWLILGALSYAAIVQTWAQLTGGDTLASVVGVRMLQAKLRVTAAKAEAALGWRPRPIDETLRDEVAWYRSPIWTRVDG